MTLRKRAFENSPLYVVLSSIAATAWGGCSARVDSDGREVNSTGTETSSPVDNSSPPTGNRVSVDTQNEVPQGPTYDSEVLYCTGGVPSRVHGLKARYAYDSLAYYTGATDHATVAPEFELVELAGQPCATSEQPEACEAEVEHARAQSASWWHYDNFFESSWTLLLATSVEGPNPSALNVVKEGWPMKPGRGIYVSRPLGALGSDAGAVDADAGAVGSDAGALSADAGAGDAAVMGFEPGATLPVVTIDYLDELQEFLGRIDTPNEAALIMFAHGRPVTCAMEQEGGSYFARGTWQISDCPVTTQDFELRVGADGTFEEKAVGSAKVSEVCVGRRPEGLCPTESHTPRDVCGTWLADTAHLEAAAVVAFAWLEQELAALGAPAPLLERTRQAARDEVVHAQLVGHLATARDAAVAPVVVRGRGVRTAFAIALENAVEGCVRECWGALCAHVQARAANSAEMRAVWQAIARDETAHAQLSRDVAAWLDTLLDENERRQVALAQASAIVALRRELDSEVAPELVSQLGLPDRATALAQFDALTRTVLNVA